MTSEIEGTQGDNGPTEEDYTPMRHDDPHQGEAGEPVLGGDEEPDPEVKALLEQASDLVIEAVERRVEPTGSTITVELSDGKQTARRTFTHTGTPAEAAAAEAQLRAGLLPRKAPEPKQYRTRTGKVLTDKDLDDLADEAERGYDVSGITPVPQGGEITDQFMVHDDDPDPRRGRGSGGGADPHALMYIGTEQDWSQRVTAFLNQKDAMEWGSAFPGRRLWRVRSITLDQPMVVVLTPAQFHLLTEDEARTHNEMEDSDD